MTTDEELPHIYTRDFEVPLYATLAVVERAGRRRRARARGAVAGLAVAAVTIAGISLGQMLPSQSPERPPAGQRSDSPPASPSPTRAPSPSKPFVRAQPGSAAPAGSIAYQDCRGGCRLLLAIPESETVDLGARIPELRPAIRAGERIEAATLSFDAQWLGIPDGRGYLVVSLREGGAVARVPDAPDGQRWSPIGWTPYSGSLALARIDDAAVTGFAIVDTSDPEGRIARVHALEENPLPGWVPFSNGGDSVLLVEKPKPGEVVTGLATQTVFVSSDQFEPGELMAGRLDLSGCLADGETLTSAQGSLAVTTPPHAGAPDVGEGANAATVVVFDAQSFEPTAVLGSDCSRREITGRSGAVPVPRTMDSTLTRRVGSSATRVVLDGPGAAGLVVFDHDQAVAVILPGQSGGM